MAGNGAGNGPQVLQRAAAGPGSAGDSAAAEELNVDNFCDDIPAAQAIEEASHETSKLPGLALANYGREAVQVATADAYVPVDQPAAAPCKLWPLAIVMPADECRSLRTPAIAHSFGGFRHRLGIRVLAWRGSIFGDRFFPPLIMPVTSICTLSATTRPLPFLPVMRILSPRAATW